ncbi:MAG: RNA polymerase sigma factor, partial [Deltaproteobacteria bacterium]
MGHSPSPIDPESPTESPKQGGDTGSSAAEAAPANAEDQALIQKLRQGDEQAFAALVARHHGPLLRLAQAYVPDRATAEGVVQDAWVGVLKGLNRFEGRSSLKTWIFRIVVNRAKTRGVRDKRRRESLKAAAAEEAGEPAVDPARFNAQGRWATPPERWSADTPEELLLRDETRA